MCRVDLSTHAHQPQNLSVSIPNCCTFSSSNLPLATQWLLHSNFFIRCCVLESISFEAVICGICAIVTAIAIAMVVVIFFSLEYIQLWPAASIAKVNWVKWSTFCYMQKYQIISVSWVSNRTTFNIMNLDGFFSSVSVFHHNFFIFNVNALFFTTLFYGLFFVRALRFIRGSKLIFFLQFFFVSSLLSCIYFKPFEIYC